MFTAAWNCLKYQKYKCSISAFTQDGQLILVNGEHNHNASFEHRQHEKLQKRSEP